MHFSPKIPGGSKKNPWSFQLKPTVIETKSPRNFNCKFLGLIFLIDPDYTINAATSAKMA